MKLNLGCGQNILEGYTNIDRHPLPPDALLPLGTEYHAIDLEKPYGLPGAQAMLQGFLHPESYEEFLASHVLEHVTNLLPLMQWCYELAKPDALFVARVPYGSSDDADEDPTHVRRFFLGSWGYFSQPFYWRADYGYRGDWQCERVTLHVKEDFPNFQVAHDAVMHERNVVTEMVAELRAVKPRREPLQELQRAYQLDIKVVK